MNLSYLACNLLFGYLSHFGNIPTRLLLTSSNSSSWIRCCEVKLIGAIAHFVTHQMDEGPIIAQQIIPLNHSFTAADMMKAGKEIEHPYLPKPLAGQSAAAEENTYPIGRCCFAVSSQNIKCSLQGSSCSAAEYFGDNNDRLADARSYQDRGCAWICIGRIYYVVAAEQLPVYCHYRKAIF